MKALVITEEGELRAVELGGDAESHLSDLQRYVGGWVQAVDLSPDATLWVNEEGKMNGLPTNICATALWSAVFGPTDVIVGPAVLTGGADDEGELMPLTKSALGRFDGIINANVID